MIDPDDRLRLVRERKTLRPSRKQEGLGVVEELTLGSKMKFLRIHEAESPLMHLK